MLPLWGSSAERCGASARASNSSSAGDVWINGTLSYNINPTVGNYGGMTLVHEIGHSIGLEHPSNYDASANSALTYWSR